MPGESEMAEQLEVGDKMVYPGHGVARVMGVEWRDISGVNKEFYVLRTINNELKILIPVDGVDRSGLRYVICEKVAQEILMILRGPYTTVETQPWSKRYREYSDMLLSGSTFDIAKLLRDLHYIKSIKGLSHNEQRFYDQARCLLATEIAITTQHDLSSVDDNIQKALDHQSLENPTG